MLTLCFQKCLYCPNAKEKQYLQKRINLKPVFRKTFGQTQHVCRKFFHGYKKKENKVSMNISVYNGPMTYTPFCKFAQIIL